MVADFPADLPATPYLLFTSRDHKDPKMYLLFLIHFFVPTIYFLPLSSNDFPPIFFQLESTFFPTGHMRFQNWVSMDTPYTPSHTPLLQNPITHQPAVPPANHQLTACHPCPIAVGLPHPCQHGRLTFVFTFTLGLSQRKLNCFSQKYQMLREQKQSYWRVPQSGRPC
jgi:hypothetical protein